MQTITTFIGLEKNSKNHRGSVFFVAGWLAGWLANKFRATEYEQ